MPQNTAAPIFGQNPSNALVSGTMSYAGELHVNVGGRQLFMAANQTGVTLSAALATTYVGICLSNPAGNASGSLPINFLLRRVSGIVTVAPAALIAFNLITGYLAAGITTHTTPLAIRSGLVGTGPTGTGKVDSACTLVGTPVWAMPLSASPVTANSPGFNIDLNGAIVIPPGGYVAIGATVAGPASGFFGGISWQEVVT